MFPPGIGSTATVASYGRSSRKIQETENWVTRVIRGNLQASLKTVNFPQDRLLYFKDINFFRNFPLEVGKSLSRWHHTA